MRTSDIAVLLLSAFALLLSGTIWLSLIGGLLGGISLILAVLAWRRARRQERGHRIALAAVVLSVLAVLSAVFLYASCTTWLVCV